MRVAGDPAARTTRGHRRAHGAGNDRHVRRAGGLAFPDVRRLFATVCLLALLAVPAAASAQEPRPLLGANVDKSVVDLSMLAPLGSRVVFSEVVGDVRTPLGEDVAKSSAGGPAGAAALARAVTWRCDRVERTFVGTAFVPDGRVLEAFNTVRTPGCRDRLAIIAPSRLKPGRTLKVTLQDRWALGDLPVEVCVTRRGDRTRCRSLAFAPGQRKLSTSRRVSRKKGILTIELRIAGLRVRRDVGVGVKAPRKRLPKMLVTGDSMIQGIDSILAERLRNRYAVVRETRPGTGVSKPLGTPWPTVARRQVKTHAPAVTVVFLGANDSFDMRTPARREVRCCGEAWTTEYLRRITSMARTYGRKGRGRVLWAVLPPPRDERLVDAANAVNIAIARLAAKEPDVELVRLDRLFGPSYREKIDGKTVRDPDGIHLSVEGEKRAAQEIIAADRGERAPR